MRQLQTQVVIVGAGLTGASAAAFLSAAGVETIVVAASPWVADSPRAHLLNSRTMEILRDQGLDELCIRQEVPRWAHVNKLWMTSLAGVELARIYCWDRAPIDAQIMRQSVPRRTGSSNRKFSSRSCSVKPNDAAPGCVSVPSLYRFSQDAEGVTARVRDLALGEEFEIRASYMIGADGARSAVAESLGLPMLGEAGIGTAVNVRFRADLSRYVAYRPASLYSVYLPAFGRFGGSGTLRLVRPFDRWIAIFPEIARDVEGVQLDSKTAIEIIQRMIGDETIDIESRASAAGLINHLVAQHYSHGRVFVPVMRSIDIPP